MLVIRDSQIRLLGEPLVDAWQKQAYEFVVREYPDEVTKRGEDGVRELIQRVLDRAARYKLTDGRDATTLLALVLVFGESVDQPPERRQLLMSPLPSAEKMKALMEELKLEAKAKRKRRKF